MLLLDIGQDLLRLRNMLDYADSKHMGEMIDAMIESIENDIGQPIALPDYELER